LLCEADGSSGNEDFETGRGKDEPAGIGRRRRA
jgi:hypothetical protein